MTSITLLVVNTVAIVVRLVESARALQIHFAGGHQVENFGDLLVDLGQLGVGLFYIGFELLSTLDERVEKLPRISVEAVVIATRRFAVER